MMWKGWLCFFQNKYVYLLACVQNCNFYVRMKNRKKGKNESFMYIIMRIMHYCSFLNQISCAFSNPVLIFWITYCSVDV